MPQKKKYTAAQKKAYAKKMRAKNKYRTKTRSMSRNQIIAKTQITKIHDFAGIDVLRPFGTSVSGLVAGQKWYLHFPANLARDNSNTATTDLTARESSRILLKNIRYTLTLLPNRKTYAPIQYRWCFGYFKGDDNAGTQSLNHSTMESIFPKLTDNLKKRHPNTSGSVTIPGGEDFYIKAQSKVYTITPKMIYDANGSDDNQSAAEQVIGESALTEGAEPMRGVWLPRNHTLNFKVNRILSYEDSDGDSLNGWCPFFGIQLIPIDYTFSRPDVPSDPDKTKWGTKPCPQLQMTCKSYFCDVN